MKTKFISFVVCLISLSTFGQAIRKEIQTTPWIDGLLSVSSQAEAQTYIGASGSGSTNSMPVVRTDWVLNTPVTNTSSSTRIYFLAYTAIGAAVAGNAQLSIYGNDTGVAAVTNFYPLKQSTIVTSLATTNTYKIDFKIGAGGRWFPTNESVGAGNSVALIAGSMGYQQLTSGTNGVNGTGLGNTNNIAAGFNVPALTNFGVTLNVGLTTNLGPVNVLGGQTNWGVLRAINPAPGLGLQISGAAADEGVWAFTAWGKSNTLFSISDSGLQLVPHIAFRRSGTNPTETILFAPTNTLTGKLFLTSGSLGAGKVLTDVSGTGEATWAAPSTGNASGITNGSLLNVTNYSILVNTARANQLNVIYGTNQVNQITVTVSTNLTLDANFPASTWVDLEVTNSGANFFNISSVTQWPNGTNLLANTKSLVRLYKSASDVFAFISTPNNTNSFVYAPFTVAIANNQVGSNTYVWDVSKAVNLITMTNNVRIVGPTGTMGAGYGQQSSLRVTNSSGSSFVLYVTNTFFAGTVAGRVWTNTVPAGGVANLAAQDNSGAVDVAGGTPQ